MLLRRRTSESITIIQAYAVGYAVGYAVAYAVGDAVGYAVLQYAMNAEDINGVRGKGNFPITPGFSDPHPHADSAE